MINDFLLLIFADILLALNFTATKAYQRDMGVSLAKGLKFNAFLGTFSAAIFFAANGFKCEINTFSAAMAAAMALLCVSYTVIGFRIMENEKMALYTVFLMTGGMAVPYIWGLIFLGEPFSLLRTGGLLIIAAAVFIINADTGRFNAKQLVLCLAVFVLNGFVSVISKEHQIAAGAVPSSSFVILSSISKTVACAAALLFIKDAPKSRGSFNPKMLLFTLLAAAFSGVSYFLQLIGAENLPATVIYPIITGGSIIFTAFAGRIFFGEKASRRMVSGIALCFLGTCMFL